MRSSKEAGSAKTAGRVRIDATSKQSTQLLSQDIASQSKRTQELDFVKAGSYNEVRLTAVGDDVALESELIVSVELNS